jgi:hypothetical protein
MKVLMGLLEGFKIIGDLLNSSGTHKGLII